MSTVLGVNAVFHDPAAALVVDGRIVAAAEEERFSRRKHGKDLCVNTPLLTDAGWLTMGTVEPGDRVHTIDGSLTEVLAVSETFTDQRCFEVRFADGQRFVAGEHHEWTVYDRRRPRGWRTVTTADLAADHIIERNGDRREFRFSVTADRVLERPVADLPVDPYVLGYWLGDGTVGDGRITVDAADLPSLLEAVDECGYVAGDPVQRDTERSVRTLRVSTSVIRRGSRVSLVGRLRSIGVLRDKHVPDEYLLASEPQRMALLRGLMDSDGSVIPGHGWPRVEFTSVRSRLAEQVLFLARSLGWKATISEGPSANGGRRFRVMWTAYRERAPFRLPRKTQALWPRPDTPTRALTNKIVAVRPVETVRTRCITVAHPSQQFLAGRGLAPTHNSPVPFSTWELPEQAMSWCLEVGGIDPSELDAVAYSYDPALAQVGSGDVMAERWEGLRTLFVERAPHFLATSLPGLDPERVRFVGHHLSHAASAYAAAGWDPCSVLVLDGRGEGASHLAGRAVGGRFEPLAAQALPHSLGLFYEELTAHLGFRRSSDEYKVMAMASYGRPAFLEALREIVYADGAGGFRVESTDFSRFAPALGAGEAWTPGHADLAHSVQARVEEVLIELAGWLHAQTGDRDLVMAGGVALNCVANSRLWAEGPFERVWVQPAAGDSGTALGAALWLARELGDTVAPMETAALGRGFSDEELEGWLRTAELEYERPDDVADAAAEVLAGGGVVAWFQGRSEFGPRALGHRSLLADPRSPEMTEKLNDVKGREQFRPVAPMVLADRAAEIFEGPLPSPYMLFTHGVRPGWAERIGAVVHVDGTARIQTVHAETEPLLARMLEAFEARTGVPVVVNTSLNTAGRPMVDDPRDALECFGSAPVDALALGPFLVRRPTSAAANQARPPVAAEVAA